MLSVQCHKVLVSHVTVIMLWNKSVQSQHVMQSDCSAIAILGLVLLQDFGHRELCLLHASKKL